MQTPAEKTQRTIEEICARHKVPAKDVLSKKRNKELVRARDEICWTLRQEDPVKWTFQKIGIRMGGRDHATIVTAVGRHEKRIQR